MEDANLPIIDLAPSLGSNEKRQSEVGRSIWNALSEFGFFYICNYGVPPEIHARARREIAAFFAQPLAEKRKCQGDAVRGYTSFLELGVGAYLGATINDMCERLIYGPEISETERAADPYYRTLAAQKLLPPNIWPSDAGAAAAQFKKSILEYYRAMEWLFHHLMSLIAIAAQLPAGFWKPLFSRHTSNLMAANYPPPPPELCQPQYTRLIEHVDFNVLTILSHENPTNGNGHLEAKLGGRWRRVPAKEGMLLVNIGELLETLTRGRLRATTHRVVAPEQSEGSQRLSLVFFCNPNPDAQLEELPSCVPAGHTPRRLDYHQYSSDILAKVRGYSG